ncbi:DEKNAAE104970 [Brettanomyces naardenensis]|uniref:ATPase inhibitor, mitochondrial n=1 Tax=Brettanomyces naardenensis TaxID=13370 RepID=A0A448YSF4_BRENA|nr:DEKNAAE104970 [Brettanomyces naardenensis]
MFAARRALTTGSKRSSLRVMAVRFNSNEGATGSVRPNGSSDNFTKRERAQEDFYIKKQQAEEIAALKAQLAKQKKQLDRLEKQNSEETEKN